MFYHRIFAVTFDESFSKATGIRVGFYNTLIAVLTSVIIVVGMRLMGALLISSLMIFPSLTSMRVFGSFRAVTISSVIVSVVCFVTGLILTYYVSLPTGATIVVINLIVFLLFTCAGIIRKIPTLIRHSHPRSFIKNCGAVLYSEYLAYGKKNE